MSMHIRISKKLLSLLVLVLTIAFSSFVSADSREDNLLMMAIEKKYIQLAQTAISSGANVNFVDSYSYTPLYTAISQNDKEMVTLLLKNEANPNTRCKNFLSESESPVEYAISLDRYNIATSLLLYGANPNTLNKHNVPIIFAATKTLLSSDSPEVKYFYETLLSKGANIKAIMPDGVNLLMYIAYYFTNPKEDKAIAFSKFLISKGLDPNTTVYAKTSGKNITALDIAIGRNASAMVKFLLPLTKK